MPCPTHQATDTSESDSDDPPPLGAFFFFKESVGKYATLRSIDLVLLKRMFVGKLVSLSTITYPFQIWIASFPKLGMMWILTWSELGLKICRFRRHSDVVRPPWQYLFIQRNSMKSLLSRRPTGQIRPCTFVRMQLAANLRRSDPESAWESRIYPVDWDCWCLQYSIFRLKFSHFAWHKRWHLNVPSLLHRNFLYWGLMEGECQEATWTVWGTVFFEMFLPIFSWCLLVSLGFSWLISGQLSLSYCCFYRSWWF